MEGYSNSGTNRDWRERCIGQVNDEMMRIASIVGSLYTSRALRCVNVKQGVGIAQTIALMIALCPVEECKKGFLKGFTMEIDQITIRKAVQSMIFNNWSAALGEKLVKRPTEILESVKVFFNVFFLSAIKLQHQENKCRKVYFDKLSVQSGR